MHVAVLLWGTVPVLGEEGVRILDAWRKRVDRVESQSVHEELNNEL